MRSRTWCLLILVGRLYLIADLIVTIWWCIAYLATKINATNAVLDEIPDDAAEEAMQLIPVEKFCITWIHTYNKLLLSAGR